MKMSGYHHRAGNQHQANKVHKTGGHSTKRDIDRQTRGRVDKSSVAGSSASSAKKSVKSLMSEFGVTRKADRINQAKQLAEQRRQQAQIEKRLAGGFGPPKQVVIFGLSAHARPESIAALLLAHADVAGVSSSAHLIGNPIAAVYNGLRQRLVITVAPRPGQIRGDEGSTGTGGSAAAGQQPFTYDIHHALAVAQSADVLLLVCDMSAGPSACIDSSGDLFLSCIKATGMPSVVGVITGVEAGSAALKAGGGVGPAAAAGTGGEGQGSSVSDLRRYAQRLLATEVSIEKEDCRIVEVTDPAHVVGDAQATAEPYAQGVAAAIRDGSVLSLARAVVAINPRHITWRSHRSYLTGMHVEWQAEGAGQQDPSGTLRVYGYLRGRPLNVGQLVTLPRGGTYALQAITAPGPEAQPYKALAKAGAAMVAAVGTSVVSKAAERPFVSLSAALCPYGTRLVSLPLAAPSGTGVTLIAVRPASRAGEHGAGMDEEGTGAAAFAPEDPTPIALDVDVDAGEQSWPEGEGAEHAGARGRAHHRLGLAEDDMEENGEEADAEEEEEEDLEEESAAAAYASGALVGLAKGSEEYLAAVEKLKAEARAKAEEERARARDRSRRARLVKAGKAVPEEDDEEEGEGEEEGEDGGEEEAGGKVDGMEDEDDAAAAAAATGAAGKNIRDMPSDTPLGRLHEASDASNFPDEIDTPINEPARLRFARYRGLKSFRTSPWEKDEGLPLDYAHIFGMASFHRTQARVLAEGNLATKALLSLEGSKVAEAKQGKKSRQAAAKAKQAAVRHAAGTAGSRGDVSMDGCAPTAAMGEEEDAEEGELTLADLLGTGWVSPGQYVCLHIAGVQASAVADACCLPPAAVTQPGGLTAGAPGLPLTLYSLLKHEGKATVVHASLTRWPAYTLPVKSRDSLEVHVWGSRVVDARPVFSSLEVGQDRARMERFLQPGRWVGASFYGPVTYTPAPILVFRRVPLGDAEAALLAAADAEKRARAAAVPGGSKDAPSAAAAAVTTPAASVAQLARVGIPADGDLNYGEELHRSDMAALYPGPDRLCADAAGRGTRLVLVATGKITHADPDTLLLKRTILTGFPVKVEGRFAAARSMFFHPADIDWFKPIAVHTKSGAQGHISMSVGTHGRMKLRFDRPITQADVICLPLYKRVFPRWGRGYKAAYPVLARHEERARGLFSHGPASALGKKVLALEGYGAGKGALQAVQEEEL